ncbi:MAG TPA: hypothetical protein HPP80_08670 [Rhodospirillaceae bacterium]|nr:hypothetical protein [Rhodospirillaceae bacterium]
MKDNFSALDLLSCGDFAFVLPASPSGKKKKGSLLDRRKAKNKKAISRLIPLITNRWPLGREQPGCHGWPVALSWPTHDITAFTGPGDTIA